MQRCIKILFISFIALGLVFCNTYFAFAEEKIKVTFLNPGSDDDPFFGMLASFMRAAAEDIDVELEIIPCDRNHLRMRQNGDAILEREERPDYLVLINEQNTAVEILKKADLLGVKTFVFNEGFFDQYKEILGEPREKHKNWLGELLPDDFQSGYLLAKEMIDLAIENGNVGDDGNVYVAGLAGVHLTSSSMQRVKGLETAVSEYTNVVINQVTPALYERERAKRISRGLIKRYPKLNIIWAASDGMALGASEAMTELDKVSGMDLYTGGVDWAAEAIDAVKTGTLTATVGGHFMDGAWALIMLYDFHHGYEFEHLRAKSKFSALTSKNIQTYLDKLGDQDWSKIDFKLYSKTYNKEIDKYDFSLDAVLENL